jgi:hypothetical protein
MSRPTLKMDSWWKRIGDSVVDRLSGRLPNTKAAT